MPRSLWFKVIVLLAALWAPLSQADTGWQPIQETIRKSDKDTRQYQAIRLDNGMVVLLVSDPQAVKSLSALVVPVGSLQDPAEHQGLAHFLVAATTPAPRRIAPPSILKWKTTPSTARSIAWPTPSPRRCWIKNMPTASVMR